MAESSREQLIDIAVEAFAANGFAATSLRGIAAKAEVSPALLIHHFGSREQLIDACITKSLGTWVSQKQGLGEVPFSEALATWQQSLDQNRSKLLFFRQVLIAGGDPAIRLLELMSREARQLIDQQQADGKVRDLNDPDAVALLMTLHGLAPLLLMDQVNQLLGGDFMTGDLSARFAGANLEIYQRGIYTADPSTNEEKENK